MLTDSTERGLEELNLGVGQFPIGAFTWLYLGRTSATVGRVCRQSGVS
jgi:hypothetical protein